MRILNSRTKLKCYRFENIIYIKTSALFGDGNFNFYGASSYMNFTGNNL